MEPNIVAIMVVVTVVIAVISFVFYWLFKEIAKKAENVIEEEETIAHVNHLPETIQSTPMPQVKPTPVRFNNESRVSRNRKTGSNRTSTDPRRPAQSSTRQNERYDDWAYANNTTNVTEVIEYAVERPSQPYVISKGGSFAGAGASAQWDDNDDSNRFVAKVVGSTIGSAVATAVTSSFREETPSYTPRKEPTQTYSFVSYETPSYESSSSSSSDSYGSSDW